MSRVVLLAILSSGLLAACAAPERRTASEPTPPRRPIAYGAVATTDTRCGTPVLREPLPRWSGCSAGMGTSNVELVYGPGLHVTIDPAGGTAYFHRDGIYLDGDYRGRLVMFGLASYGLADTTMVGGRWVISSSRTPTSVRPAPGRAVLHRCSQWHESQSSMAPELDVVNAFPRWVFGYPTDRFEDGRKGSVFLRPGIDIPLSVTPGAEPWAIARFDGAVPVRVFGGPDSVDGPGPKGTLAVIVDDGGIARGYVPEAAVAETRRGFYSHYEPDRYDPRHLRGQHPGGPEPSGVLRCSGVTPATRVEGAHYGFAGKVLHSDHVFDYEPIGPTDDGWVPVRMAFPLRTYQDDPVFELESYATHVALGLDPGQSHFVPAKYLRKCKYLDRGADGHWVSRVRLPDGTPVGPWAAAIPCKCQKGWEGAGRCDGWLSEAPLDMPDRPKPRFPDR